MLPIVFFALAFAGAAFNIIAFSAVHNLWYPQIHNLLLASSRLIKETRRILVSGGPHIHLLDGSPRAPEWRGYPLADYGYTWGLSSGGNIWRITSTVQVSGYRPIRTFSPSPSPSSFPGQTVSTPGTHPLWIVLLGLLALLLLLMPEPDCLKNKKDKVCISHTFLLRIFAK